MPILTARSLCHPDTISAHHNQIFIQEVAPSSQHTVEGVVACATCCAGSSALVGCYDGSVKLLGSSSCTHSLDSAPIVCCTSSQTSSGAILVAACTRETLHLLLIDQAELSYVRQEHRCPLNTIIPQCSHANVVISPCSRHILVTDICSVSTYSISEATIPVAASPSSGGKSTETEPDEICLRQFKLSMTFHAPHKVQQGSEDPKHRNTSPPFAHWRIQHPMKGSVKPSTHFNLLGMV
jgi:hypothetical protein